MPDPSSRLASRLALLGAGLLAGLLGAELLLRTLPALRPGRDARALHETRLDRPWLFGLRPGARGRMRDTGDVLYEVNADGFRDRPRARPAPPGVGRIVVLGDSITFGYGVAAEAAYPQVMERLLDGRAEVLNLGVTGYNPYTEQELLGDVGLDYEPDLVLVQFCVNDLIDPTLHFDTQTLLRLGAIPDLAYPDPVARRPALSPTARRLLLGCHRLRVCALLDDAWIRLHPNPRPRAELTASLHSPDHLPGEPVPSWLAARYLAMARLAAGVGADFAVLGFPHRAQLQRPAARRLASELVELGDASGWTAIDLLPAFLEARGGEPLFMDIWHPTAAGHRVAAAALLDELERRELLP